MSECTAFPGPIFTDLTNGQQYYVQNSYSEFGPNWAINLESTDRNPFTTLRKVRPLLYQYLQNTWRLTELLWTSPVQNFIHIGGKFRKYGWIFIYAYT